MLDGALCVATICSCLWPLGTVSRELAAVLLRRGCLGRQGMWVQSQGSCSLAAHPEDASCVLHEEVGARGKALHPKQTDKQARVLP